MLQFGVCVVDAELPVDPGLFAITLLGPSRHFRRDQSPALDPAIQALAVQRTELQLCDVQPAPVFRRVHQMDAVVQPTGFGRRERDRFASVRTASPNPTSCAVWCRAPSASRDSGSPNIHAVHAPRRR